MNKINIGVWTAVTVLFLLLVRAYYAIQANESAKPGGPSDTTDTDKFTDFNEVDTLNRDLIGAWYVQNYALITRKPEIFHALIHPVVIGDEALLRSIRKFCGSDVDLNRTILQAFYDQKIQQVIIARIITYKTMEPQIQALLKAGKFMETGIVIIKDDGEAPEEI